jgi:hypothetical protein
VRSEILEKNPDAKIAVYAVWFRNLWSDARFLWPSTALDDPRVVNFWDSEKTTGRWYAANVTHRGSVIEWDAWFLYAPGKGFSDLPLGWGRTIVDSRESLQADVEKLMHGSGGNTEKTSR